MQNQVELYVASWCPYSEKAEEFLKEKGIKFKKYDVENDMIGRAKYKLIKGKNFPIIKINDKIIRGYNPDFIWKVLGE